MAVIDPNQWVSMEKVWLFNVAPLSMSPHLTVQSNKYLAKRKSQKLESGFHAMKLSNLRLNFIQNPEHLKNKIRFLQIGIIFLYFVPEEEIEF